MCSTVIQPFALYHVDVDSVIDNRLNQTRTIEAAVHYMRMKNFYCIHILYHTHILNQMIESCTIQGIDIDDEFTRGSQYKIENILLRINNTPTYSFICLNATEAQVSFLIRSYRSWLCNLLQSQFL